jgi:hypothetical protein
VFVLFFYEYNKEAWINQKLIMDAFDRFSKEFLENPAHGNYMQHTRQVPLGSDDLMNLLE